jgi:hypothetical protein
MQDNLIILNKDNGTIVTFGTTELSEDWKKSLNIKIVKVENNSGLIDIDVSQDDLISVFLYYRNYTKLNYPDFYESIGTNKTTTIDYINLQTLGVSTYKSVLASFYNAKVLTIRDRIAYARRHGWIPKAGQGNRRALINA